MRKIMVMLGALVFAGGASAQDAKAQQWEYGNYYEAQLGTRFFFGWQQGAEQDSWGSREEFLQALGCPSEKEFTNNVMIFDCLGKQGWELVSISRENVPSNDDLNYFFKRPVK